MTEGERHWEDFRRNADDDPGSLRELWLHPATRDDWSRLLRLVRESYVFTFGTGDETLPLPIDAGAIFDARAGETRSLSIRVAEGATINTHFFDPDAMELDISPRQITSAATLDALFTFMRRLATLLDRDVTMTLEGMGGPEWSERHGEHAIFRARPGVTELSHSPVIWGPRVEMHGRFVAGVWVSDDDAS